MPITNCPGCGKSLEVPSVVPGGVVACPYCGVEFPVQQSRAAAPRRGGGGGRRRRDDYGYDERYDERPRYRKRTDPLPLVVGGLCAVLILGGGMFLLLRAQKKKAETQDAELSELARLGPAYTTFNRIPDRPERDPEDFPNIFEKGDRVTLRRLTHNASLSFAQHGQGEKETVWSYVLDATSDRDAETVVEKEGNVTTHKGIYKILSYAVNRPLVTTETLVSATFKLDNRGRLVRGSFQLESGPSLNPVPLMIADRNLGVLPDVPKRRIETWGTETLVNPFAGHVRIGGMNYEDIPLAEPRQGGWRWEGGNLKMRQTKEGVRSWARGATADFELKACENRRMANGTYNGKPADISATMVWKGKASYDLRRKLLGTVTELNVTIWVRVKTATACYDWTGASITDYIIFKSP